MNKIFSASVSLIMVLLPAAVFAVENSSAVVVPIEPVITTVASVPEPIVNLDQESKIGKLTASGLQLFNTRIFSLSALKIKIQANKNLIPEQQTALITDIEGNVANLHALATEIKNWGGDAAGLRAKVQSVYTDFRVFAVLIPKIHLQAALFVQGNHATKLDDAFVKVQEKITAANKNGADITKWQEALGAAKAKKAAITTQILSNKGLIDGLKPADYPDTSKQIVTAGLAAIVENNKNFKDIRLSLSFVNRMNTETKQTAMKSARDAFNAAMKLAQDDFRIAQEKLFAARKAAQNAFKAAVAELNKK